MAVFVEAYMVVIDTPPCERCGGGRRWTVCGPEGVNGSTSYGDESDAEHEADILNAAYNAGRASGIYDASPVVLDQSAKDALALHRLKVRNEEAK